MDMVDLAKQNDGVQYVLVYDDIFFAMLTANLLRVSVVKMSYRP